MGEETSSAQQTEVVALAKMVRFRNASEYPAACRFSRFSWSVDSSKQKLNMDLRWPILSIPHEKLIVFLLFIHRRCDWRSSCVYKCVACTVHGTSCVIADVDDSLDVASLRRLSGIFEPSGVRIISAW